METKSNKPVPQPGVGSLSSISQDPPDTTGRSGTVSPGRFWALSVGVCLGLFLSLIDTSIVATSLYSIGSDLNSLKSVNWVALAYTLTYLGCAVAFARVSDVIGRKNAFLAAYVLFFAFSLACGFARDLQQLIAFRAIQGLGGSGLYSLSVIILPEKCPAHLLQFVGSLIGMVLATSGVLGPVLGGILTQYAGWRWVFWINGPIGVVSLCIFFFSWPETSEEMNAKKRPWSTFDYVGTVLIIAAAVLVVFAFQNAGESTATVWTKGIFLGPLIVGCLCWIALIAWGFVLQRSNTKGHIAPAFPIELFGNRQYLAGSMATLCIGFPYLLIVFSFPMRAQIVSEKSALIAGVMLLPMLGTAAIGSAVSGKINTGKNYVFESLLVGASLMTMGCGLLTTVHGTEDDSKALGFLVFTGLGFGISTAAATIMVSLEVPIVHTAAGQGILAQLRILGGSLGISMSTVLLHNEIKDRLGGNVTQHLLKRFVMSSDGLPAGSMLALKAAYSEAFRLGMIAATCVAGLGVLFSLLAYRTGRTDAQEQLKILAMNERIRVDEETRTRNDMPK